MPHLSGWATNARRTPRGEMFLKVFILNKKFPTPNQRFLKISLALEPPLIYNLIIRTL
jgi:hypothetical protein